MKTNVDSENSFVNCVNKAKFVKGDAYSNGVSYLKNPDKDIL